MKGIADPGQMASVHNVELSAGTLLAVTSAPSSEPHNHVSLIQLQFDPSCPISIRAQSPWLQMRFGALGLWEGIWVSSRLPSRPVGQNPHWYSQLDVTLTPLPNSGGLIWRACHGFENQHSSEGTFAVEISLKILNHLIWVQGQVFLYLSFLLLSVCLL